MRKMMGIAEMAVEHPEKIAISILSAGSRRDVCFNKQSRCSDNF
jgi:hypothetical protein